MSQNFIERTFPALELSRIVPLRNRYTGRIHTQQQKEVFARAYDFGLGGNTVSNFATYWHYVHLSKLQLSSLRTQAARNHFGAERVDAAIAVLEAAIETPATYYDLFPESVHELANSVFRSQNGAFDQDINLAWEILFYDGKDNPKSIWGIVNNKRDLFMFVKGDSRDSRIPEALIAYRELVQNGTKVCCKVKSSRVQECNTFNDDFVQQHSYSLQRIEWMIDDLKRGKDRSTFMRIAA